MAELILGGNGKLKVTVDASTLNRHGLIAGATGTGKTVSLQVLVEQLSLAGVPVFVPDIKGDLSGLATPGKDHPKVQERVTYIGLDNHSFRSMPCVFWDINGDKGHPIRTTVSELGPLLLSNLLELTETQTGILYACFREADNRGWLMLDLDDLNSMLQWLADNAEELRAEYGNIAVSSVGAIKRRLLVLEEQGLDKFLGEPAVEVSDLLRTDQNGCGMVNILEAAKLIEQAPQLYATMLLWLLSELYEDLPEAGDLDKPKLVIFIDEAHLVFKTANKTLLEKIEQTVRLIRSKGVGVFFITQSPLDIPDTVAGQLGLKIQHALRAFTAKDKKSLKAVAENFRPNDAFDTLTVLPELGIGEALVSCLDTSGRPQMVEKTLMSPPCSKIGPLAENELKAVIKQSPHGNKFDERINRESAHELLLKRAEQRIENTAPPPTNNRPAKNRTTKTTTSTRSSGSSSRSRSSPGSRRQSTGEAFVKSVSRAIGSQLGRQIVRGIMGSIFKGRR